jgi:hypothetical protein
MTNPNSNAQRSFVMEPFDSVADVLASKRITPALAGSRVYTKDGVAFDILNSTAVLWDQETAGGAHLEAIPLGGLTFLEAYGMAADNTAAKNVAAWNKAIASVPRGGALVLPRGRIRIDSTLVNPIPGTKIYGTGSQKSESTYVIGTVVEKIGDFVGLRCTGYNIHVSDVTIVGSVRVKGSGMGSGHGLVMAGRGCTVGRYVGRYNTGYGLLANAENASGTPDVENTHWARFYDGFTEYNGAGGVAFYAADPNTYGGRMNQNMVENWTSRHNDGEAFDNGSGSYMLYINCDAEYNLGFGYRFRKGSYTTLVNCHSEQNQGHNSAVDAGDGVRIEDGVVQIRFVGGTYSEGGGGSNFESGISYDPAATQQDRDIRMMGAFYKDRWLSSTTYPDGYKRMHFQAKNYRNANGAIAGYSATVANSASLEMTAAFFAERKSATAISAKIAVGKNGTDQEKGGVDVVEFISNPASNKTGMLLLVNNGTVTSVQEVTIGESNSGGSGFRVLRVPN